MLTSLLASDFTLDVLVADAETEVVAGVDLLFEFAGGDELGRDRSLFFGLLLALLPGLRVSVFATKLLSAMLLPGSCPGLMRCLAALKAILLLPKTFAQ